MPKALTDALLRSLKPPESGRLEIADIRCRGLCFRVTAHGARSWCFRFRDPETGKSARFTIGPYPAILLGEARGRADKLRSQAKAGNNPVAAKRQARSDAASKTFGALSHRYIVEYAQRHKRSARVDEGNLNRHILPRWRDRRFAGITRGDVIELVESLVTAGKPVAANRVHSLISGIFSFAIDAGLLSAHPAAGLKKRGREGVGNRVLSDDEIRAFWSATQTGPRSRQVNLALRLLLLTGCRVSEISGLSRDELEALHDPTRAALNIPGSRIKNGRDFYLPLSAPAREIVTELAGATAGQYLFPTQSLRRKGAIRGTTVSNAMLRISEGLAREVPSWNIEPPSAHDLRRTVETRLSALGVPREDRDAVLNHVVTGVGARHYDRYDRATEKRRALDIWAGALARILANDPGATVVPLVRHGG